MYFFLLLGWFFLLLLLLFGDTIMPLGRVVPPFLGVMMISRLLVQQSPFPWLRFSFFLSPILYTVAMHNRENVHLMKWSLLFLFLLICIHSQRERERTNRVSYTQVSILLYFSKNRWTDRERERGDEGISWKYITNRDLSLLFLYIVSIQHHHTTSFMIYRPFRFLFCSFFPFVSFILFPNT